ncbi:arabinogalactan endo-1,4-beta-galactosidase [Mucilaginibacter sp. BJC16-A38]|uniref:arabinogalactan endo-1,4-beta-galactosidase n=1 Tax=Mucilaginibacter phenanthrenivorans TaxID=1234842 RepID=UPI0021588452|nr:arabinogalactan endo-1,4-beta-galactosidase [Mucilaginibacter phenanthrenivorans]MCR8558648.1 arabinogalactan endo-1,4-beta-galactosidase [Mucilaginibacter phenanthrenivorans]
MLKVFKTITASMTVAVLILFIAEVADAQRGRTPKPSGVPAEIQVTPYKTTMIADGKDEVLINIKIIDSKGDSVPGVKIPVTLHITGDAKIVKIYNAGDINSLAHTDSTWQITVATSCRLVLQAGRTLGHIKFEAKADSLYPGSTEIHTVQPGVAHAVTTGKYVPKTVKGKILGADISFLPELESKGIKFSDVNGTPGDAILIMKEHGFNYIRLRIFNAPANAKGYSPNKGFCDLEHTKQMAKRIKAAGMKFLLDFHYSDYWADPQQQNKPAAWVGQDFTMLKKSLYDYTVNVMQSLKDQGTTPDMVQVGNEINHGIVWPEGAINNLDSLSQLLYEGIKGVKAVSPSTAIMLHIALGGQNAESRFFLDNMAKRNVPFDVIGLSYYPKWHGTPADLKNNMADLAKRYKKQVMVAEYSQLKNQVNDIAFTAPGDKALGSFIWEPLSTWEGIFDRSGRANDYMNVYPGIAKQYLDDE